MEINEARTMVGSRQYGPETELCMCYAISITASNKRPSPAQRKVMILINTQAFIRIFTVIQILE